MRFLNTVTRAMLIGAYAAIVLIFSIGIVVFVPAMDAGLFCPISVSLMDTVESPILKGILVPAGITEAMVSGVLYLATLCSLLFWSCAKINRILQRKTP